jgi:methyl-accepting chemotaxis protein
MKRNTREMLSIFIVLTLSLSIILPLFSVSAALTAPTISDYTTTVGKTLTVTGTAGDVTSGATVNVFWDIAIGAGARLLNTTTGKSDGSYTVEIDVPDTVNGSHYVWVEDTATSARASSTAVNISRTTKLDPSRGLSGDEIEVTGTGFSAENPVTIVFRNASVEYVPTTVPAAVETDEWGSFTATFDVPSAVAGSQNYGTFTVRASDDVAVLNSTATYIVGPSIALDPDEGPEGTVIDVTGKGFTGGAVLSVGNVTWDDTYSMLIVGNTITVASGGTFSGDIVVPAWGEGEYEINISDGIVWANASFTIDGEAKVTVDPSYGAPGATITVSGANYTQIAGLDVTVIINTTAPQTLVTATTLADGTWTATFTAPAVAFQNYKINASDEYSVWDDAGFKVGLIAMIINPTSGPSGDEVALTGIGFANGDYNMSFGDDETYLEGTVVSEAISDTFYVPTLTPGTYYVSVTDSNENVLTTVFTITAATSLTPSPPEVAIGYNMSMFGEDYSNAAGTALTWYIYNSTWSEEISPQSMGADVTVAASGNFTGYWVLTNDTLLGNTYTINATDANDLWAEFDFMVVPESIEIWPNSPAYSLGEIITFTIRATFAKTNAELQLWDSMGDLIFKSTLDDWELVDTWETIIYWNQVNDVGGNPFLIPTDSDIGTWVWNITDTDDELVIGGTIEVLPTTAAQVDARLSDVEGSLADLADDIAGVTSDLGDEIDGLSSEIGDVASDVDNLRDEIVGDLSDDIAAATAAANAAGDAVTDLEGSLSDLESSVSDIADTANSAADAAASAADAADNAASAAEDASSAASGLTTLVYGAIGASLIAALAAIVSLMQISRRIAG